MGTKGFWEIGIMMLLIWGKLTCAAEASRVNLSDSVCPVESITDWILRSRDFNCPLTRNIESHRFAGVIKGNEIILQRALNLVRRNGKQYVALLFYASWCPFSRIFWPSFSVLSSLYTTIPHIAIEESAVRPSFLSKYGVHGFPALFLLNSTMHAHYLGSRTLGSLVAFYNDVAGIKAVETDETSLDKVGYLDNHEMQSDTNHDNCSFSWARSPESFARQETYLALASVFVILRLFYFLHPTLLLCAQYAWRRHIRNVKLWILLEHPLGFLDKTIQLFYSLWEPCKQRNLQGGAINARAWASRSLATVSIGDATPNTGMPLSECC